MKSLDRYEEIRFLRDDSLGLKVILAVHSFGNEGIAIGGCRVANYRNTHEAEADAKMLAKNMTLKYKVVGLGYGGMKLVVHEIDNSKRKDSFRRIGRWIDECAGRCYLATDAGSTIDDMADANAETPYIVETPKESGGFGSFTPLLASGVINGLRAAIESAYETETFGNLDAYVLGLGNAGMKIAESLGRMNCKVYGFDVRQERNFEAKASGVSIEKDFTKSSYGLFVPCATGYAVNKRNCDLLDAKIIGGAANNPIEPGAEEALAGRGVVCIPDFVISSGAIVLDDLIVKGKHPTMEEGLKRTEVIYDFTKRLIAEGRKTKEKMSDTALRLLGYET